MVLQVSLVPLVSSQGQNFMCFCWKDCIIAYPSKWATTENSSFSAICPNSPFDKEIIEETVIGHFNDMRYRLLKGLQLNGPWQGKDKWTSETQGYGKKLPKGKTMNELVWSCDFEKEAKAALNPKCTNDQPKAPNGKTGLFYKMDIDWDVPEITSAAWAWMEEIEKSAVRDNAISNKAVTFKDAALRQYLNLMRPSITKIGCAEVLCKEKGVNKYRAFCLTDQAPLKDNEVVYEAGKGGCDKGETCPKGLTCKKGLCAKP
ncbi:hypothetical protein Y032_0346g3142 [Ancylostoma ceylanicum]|uniref:SCP domain-containing protein n=1 Tax=Ancylostoma ceylanicum TaxID=53326 RepID=A0A016RXC5_9BILA|nr:hypothetical protein Y032_0346g3142 [Ancylostoma ceylanicum]